MGAAKGMTCRQPRGVLRAAAFTAALLGAAAAALVAVEGECDVARGDLHCRGVPSQLNVARTTGVASVAAENPEEVAPVEPPAGAATEGLGALGAEPATGTNASELATKVRREELGAIPVGFVMSLLAFVTLWILGTIKFIIDGSLPARLALLGLLPEAYAAISVRAVAALLRLKSRPTPVVVLRNCVSDDGAKELAEAMLTYGKRANLQVLEMPHNPGVSEIGLQHLVSAVLHADGPPLQELDVSYNPQLKDTAVAVVLPLLKPKASQIDTLKLADCGISASFALQLASKAAVSKLRVLDLSYNDLAGAGETLAALCEAPVLEELVLACCGLRPDDLAAVAEQLPYTSLRSLQLAGNGFGGAGLLALTKHLPNSQIDELGLERNDLEVSHLSALGQAWAVRPFSRIRLRGNKMSQAELANFFQTLRSIHS